MSVPRLLVLTDRHQLPSGGDLVDHLAQCARAGLTHVLLRELDLPDGDRAALVAPLRRAGLRVWSAHRALPGAEGVHLPGRRWSTARKAPVSKPPGSSGVPWGRSCHNRDDVARAAEAGASWVTLSPVAASASKPGRPPLEWESLAGNGVPVLALGGVDAGNARAIRQAGAHGVAAMGAVMRADEPAELVEDLLEATR